MKLEEIQKGYIQALWVSYAPSRLHAVHVKNYRYVNLSQWL